MSGDKTKNKMNSLKIRGKRGVHLKINVLYIAGSRSPKLQLCTGAWVTVGLGYPICWILLQNFLNEIGPVDDLGLYGMGKSPVIGIIPVHEIMGRERERVSSSSVTNVPHLWNRSKARFLFSLTFLRSCMSFQSNQSQSGWEGLSPPKPVPVRLTSCCTFFRCVG